MRSGSQKNRELSDAVWPGFAECERHERLFYPKTLGLSQELPAPRDSGAAPVLPPRRQWRRPDRSARSGQNNDTVCKRAIWNTITLQLQKGTLAEQDWGRRLVALHDAVQHAIRTPASLRFEPPVIVLSEKRMPGQYRVMALCATLEDRILSGVLARYLADLIEPALSDTCYSFRRRQRTHHTAVRDLAAFRTAQADRPLHVAECDIRGFFDTLRHDRIQPAIVTLAHETGAEPDPAAITLLQALLDSYSFPEYALPQAQRKLAETHPKGTVPWLDNEQRARLYSGCPDAAIGVPQGNPVSPILANAVLARADHAVLNVLGARGCYARYCDDVVMVHPEKAVCADALDTYIRVLDDLSLPVHRPMPSPETYGAPHYIMKSRLPYLWADLVTEACGMPWLPFVGYQIHASGAVRIRKVSLERQKQSMDRVAETLFAHVGKARKAGWRIRTSGPYIYHRVAHRIIRAGTGDRNPRSGGRPEREPCWLDCFPAIAFNASVAAQMRELDRHREIVLRKLKHRLRKRGLWKDKTPPLPTVEHPKPESYYGAPYSYFGTLRQETKRKPEPAKGYNL
jgi:hypothetical protein